MKFGRIALSLVGLVCLFLAYITGSLYLLAIAVVAFFVGLYLMSRPRKKEEDDQKQRKKRKANNPSK